MAQYLLRLNLKSDSIPYTLEIRDNCYGSKVIINIARAQLSFLYRARSSRVTVIAHRGSDTITRSMCLQRGCNRASFSYSFGVQSPTETIYGFTLTDRNYGLPLDGILNFSN